jgi:hypothetical protein
VSTDLDIWSPPICYNPRRRSLGWWIDVAQYGAKTGQVVGPQTVQTRRLQDLVEETRLLHERLHRVAIGLALSEELLATTLEELAQARSRDSGRYRLQANRARVAAEECRLFARRLDELDPEQKDSRAEWDNPFPGENETSER